jgi:hypothetical protein
LLPGIDTLNAPGDIIPTIVYADNRSTVCKMANSFWNRVPNDWRSKFPFTFCDLSTGLSTERRRLVVAATQRGFCRILFATQVAEVGIDFPGIERVVQWCIPQTLSAAGLYQRFGRAARTDGMVGVGILFHTQHAVIPVNKPDHPLRCLQDSPKTGDVRGILQLIQAFDSGSHRKDQVATTALECAADISLDKDDIQHGGDQSEQALEVPEDDQDTLAFHEDSNIAGNSFSSGFQTTGRSDKLPSLCRMLMWIVNTNGCIGEALMRYFDEADFSSGDYAPSSNFPCCDRHTTYQDLPASFCRLLPVLPDQHEASDELHEFQLDDSDTEEINVSSQLDDPDTEDLNVSSQRKRKPLNHPQKTAIVHALQTLRADIWQELQLGGLYSPFSSYTLISDEDIRILSTKAPYILDAPDTASNTVPALRRLVGIGVTNILPRFLDTMQLAVDSVPASQGTRRGQHSLHHPAPMQMETRSGAQRIQQAEYHVPHDGDLESCPSDLAPEGNHSPEPVLDPSAERHSPTHLRQPGFKNDSQDETTLDPRILACLPKRGKGRPSAADKAARTRLIEQLIQEFAGVEASVVGTVI